MSTWHNITVPEDVEINKSDDTLEIYIGEDYGGAIYVSVDMNIIKNILNESSNPSEA
jgi:hypothetical protein